jgi:hypothetical protein
MNLFGLPSLPISMPAPAAFLRPRSAWWFFAPLLVFSGLIYGYLFATNAPFIILPFFIPPLVLAGLVIWALPAAKQGPTALLDTFFLAFFITLVMWPNYLALALPGLPWITVARLTGFPLALALLICVSVSNEFRANLKNVLSASPWQWKLLVSFVVIQFLSLAFTKGLTHSAQKFVVDQFNWTAIFFASCYFFLKPRRALLWSRLMWFMALFVTVIAAWESRIGHPPWAGHIPWFLVIEDESVLRTLAGSVRAYTTQYRAESTFGTALALGEYIALAFPFVIHIMINDERSHVRVAAAASLPILIYGVILSGARLGLIGCIISLLGYGLIWGIDRWRRQPESLIGPALVLAYPTVFVVTVGAVFFVGRIHNLVVGNGAQQASNDARIGMYNSAIPKVFSQPWGYGIGEGAATLGFRSPDGLLAIDSNYIAVVLEYGIIGFAVYYGLLALSAYKAGKSWWRGSAEKETMLFAPLGLALISVLVMKMVFADEDNDALLFMMMGMIGALVFRLKAQRSSSSLSPL